MKKNQTTTKKKKKVKWYVCKECLAEVRGGGGDNDEVNQLYCHIDSMHPEYIDSLKALEAVKIADWWEAIESKFTIKYETI